MSFVSGTASRLASGTGLSRRALVVGGAAGLIGTATLSGCTGPSDARAPQPPAKPSETPQPPSDADAAADLKTLGVALGVTLALEKLVQATGGKHRGLRADLRGLTGLHREHRRVLEQAHSEPEIAAEPTPKVPSTPAAAVKLLRRRESQAQEQLLGLVVEARSGPFAQLLASMSAGIAAYTSEQGWPIKEPTQ